MESIFRELKCAYAVLSLSKECEEYANIKNEPVSLRNKRREALNSLMAYIDSGVWCRNTKNKEEFLLNYRLTTKEYAMKTGRSEADIRQVFKRMSDKLRETLGYSSIYTIMTCKEEELSSIEFEFQLASSSSLIDDYLLEPIKPFISDAKVNKEYSIEELEKELSFLRIYSKSFMYSQLEKLDKNKLQYIVSMLRGQSTEGLSKLTDIVKEIQSQKKITFLTVLVQSFKKGKIERSILSIYKKIDKLLKKEDKDANITAK